MPKPRVFLGSSGKSYTLVRWLAKQLKKNQIATTVEWKVDGFPPGASTLENLIKNCRNADFAVIFLTEDDSVLKDSTAGKELYAPRDNCIFEAGLFTGVLGPDSKRCLLVSSVEQEALPSDLRGLTLLELPKLEVGETINSAWCDAQMQDILEAVRQQIEDLKSFLLRPVLTVYTNDQLADLERVGDGDLNKGESVVVNSVEPVERSNLSFAMRVVNNIYERIRYHYFFKGAQDGAFRWVELLRTLILASIARANEDVSMPKSEEQISKFLEVNRNDAINAVKQLEVWLRIHLLAKSQEIPLKICVHNAQSEVAAKCYFRYTRQDFDYFVHWCSGAEARAVVRELLELSTVEAGNAIFCPTRLFELYSNDEKSEGTLTRQAIVNEIENFFPEPLREVLVSACLSSK